MIGDFTTIFPSFTFTKCDAKLKVVRIDSRIGGEDQEAECQKLNANYHAVQMNDAVTFEVRQSCLIKKEAM